MSQANILPFQSKYKVIVAGVDVTDEIVSDITIAHELMMPVIATLSFRYDSVVTETSFGVMATIWGGYVREHLYSGPNIIESAEEYGILFRGELKKKSLGADGRGLVCLNLIFYGTSYSVGGHARRIYRYPGDSNEEIARKWASVSSLSLSQIVKGICDDMGKDCEIELGAIKDKVYTRTAPLVQGDTSDMNFLNSIAQINGCYVWTEYADPNSATKDTIHFKSKRSVVKEVDLKFVYLMQSKASPLSVYDFVKQDFIPNRLYLLNCNLDCDPLTMGVPVTTVDDYNFSTGETEKVFAMYDETKNEVIYYRLDYDKVQKLQETEEGQALANKIQNFGAFGIPWENPDNPELAAKSYFIPENITKDVLDQLDYPVYGITLTATCLGSISIKPFRSYTILGVPALHKSLAKREFTFFLRAMTHVISKEGFTTNLEFKA